MAGRGELDRLAVHGAVVSAHNAAADAWCVADSEAARLVEGMSFGDYVYRYEDDGEEPSEMTVQSARELLRGLAPRLGLATDDRGLRVVCASCQAPVACSTCRCGDAS